MRKLFRSLAREWEAYGHVDPLFAVLSDPRKRGGQWNADLFFESGRRHVASMLGGLRDVGVEVRSGTCLDFGCGVGRLTQPFCEYFERVVGIDVARSMISQARRYNRYGARCHFLVNRAPDLRRFADGSFDLVHSCLVLQHLPPELSHAYVGEFFRVAKPGAVVVFQQPAALRPPELSAGAFALPAAGYAAGITLADQLPVFRAGEHAVVLLRVRNAGPVAWRHDPPTDDAGRIRLGNHWLAGGVVVTRDDGRADLPRTLDSGEDADVSLTVRAPDRPGVYTLEFDLVQELVAWFADRGSPTLCVNVEVDGAASLPAEARPDGRALGRTPAEAAPTPVARPRGQIRRGLLAAVLGWRYRVKPTFPMHVVPKADVERLVAEHGGQLIRVFEDNACGAGWVSYTYVCRRVESR